MTMEQNLGSLDVLRVSCFADAVPNNEKASRDGGERVGRVGGIVWIKVERSLFPEEDLQELVWDQPLVACLKNVTSRLRLFLPLHLASIHQSDTRDLELYEIC
jgi:hypothetical protein